MGDSDGNPPSTVEDEMTYAAQLFDSYPDEFVQDVGGNVVEYSSYAVDSLKERLIKELPEVDASKIEKSCKQYFRHIDIAVCDIFDTIFAGYAKRNLLTIPSDTALPQDQICMAKPELDVPTSEEIQSLEARIRQVQMERAILKDELHCLGATEPLLLSLSSHLELMDENSAKAIAESVNQGEKIVAHAKSLLSGQSVQD